MAGIYGGNSVGANYSNAQLADQNNFFDIGLGGLFIHKYLNTYAGRKKSPLTHSSLKRVYL